MPHANIHGEGDDEGVDKGLEDESRQGVVHQECPDGGGIRQEHTRVQGDAGTNEPRADTLAKGRAYVDLVQKRAMYYEHCRPISDYLEKIGPELLETLLVKDADLQNWKSYVFDIVTPESHRCSCFTKSYCKYVRGTGSVLSSNFYDDSGR
jgi:hypothetical protein